MITAVCKLFIFSLSEKFMVILLKCSTFFSLELNTNEHKPCSVLLMLLLASRLAWWLQAGALKNVF